MQTRLVSRARAVPRLTEQGADTVVVTAECATSGLCLDIAIQLTAAGVVRCRAGLTNRAAERYRLDGLSLLLPAGERATHTVELDAQPLAVGPAADGAFAVPAVAGRTRPWWSPRPGRDTGAVRSGRRTLRSAGR